MNAAHPAIVVFALIGLLGAMAAGAAPARADQAQTSGTRLQASDTPKPKAHKRVPKQEASRPSAAEEYTVPLELNFDPMKRVILKAEPSVPYQPVVTSKLPPTTKTGDDRAHTRLAPLLRETSIPESFGDRGSFIDRHEFGIQLHDHF
jgi:hypothetical protein